MTGSSSSSEEESSLSSSSLLSLSRKKKQVIGAIVLVVCLAVISTLYVIPSATSNTNTASTTIQIDNLIAPPTANEHKALITNIKMESNCSIEFDIEETFEDINNKHKHNKIKHIKPIWVPSFPGSGAELFRELITGITLKPTIDGALIGTCQKASVSIHDPVVTCKTHWPTLNSTTQFQDPMIQSSKSASKYYSKDVIVLIRNPMNAIPSWYNQIYETKVGKTYHSKGAPLKSWNKWMAKSNQITNKLKQWKDLILFWLLLDQDSYYNVKGWIPFEYIISTKRGPQILKKLVKPILEKNSVDVLEDINCIWDYCVNLRSDMKRNHTGKQYHPGFLQGHQKYFIKILDELINEITTNKMMESEQSSSQQDPLQLLVDTLHVYKQNIINNFVLVQYNHTGSEQPIRGKHNQNQQTQNQQQQSNNTVITNTNNTTTATTTTTTTSTATATAIATNTSTTTKTTNNNNTN